LIRKKIKIVKIVIPIDDPAAFNNKHSLLFCCPQVRVILNKRPFTSESKLAFAKPS